MKRILVFTIMVVMVLTVNFVFIGNAFAAPTIADVPDTALKNALNLILGKEEGLDITQDELNALIGEVNLSGNGIVNLKGIEHLINAQDIDLSHNKFSKVPSNISDLKKVVKLNLSYNKFYSLPDSISGMSKLETLILDANNMKTLPTTLKDIMGLKYLSIEGNRITKMPSVLTNLDLDELYIRYNFLDLTESVTSSKIDLLFASCDLYYDEQLVPLTEIIITQDIDRNVIISWELLEDKTFPSGVEATAGRFSILKNNSFIGYTTGDVNQYVVEGMSVGDEVRFSVSCDYSVSVLPGHLVKSYTENQSYTVLEALPTMSPSPSPTIDPDATSSPTPAPDITAEVIGDTNSPEPTDETKATDDGNPQDIVTDEDEGEEKPPLDLVKILFILIGTAVLLLIVIIVILATKRR